MRIWIFKENGSFFFNLCTNSMIMVFSSNLFAKKNPLVLLPMLTQHFSHSLVGLLMSCQPRGTVMLCFVYKVIRDLESIDHLCIVLILSCG